jgi:hypothetical protein
MQGAKGKVGYHIFALLRGSLVGLDPGTFIKIKDLSKPAHAFLCVDAAVDVVAHSKRFSAIYAAFKIWAHFKFSDRLY